MKTIKTMFVFLAAVLTVNLVSASGVVKLEVDANNSETAFVEITSLKMGEIEIKVNDSYGDILYSKKTVAPIGDYKTKLDLSQLEDGFYRFSVKINDEKTESRLSVENGEVKVVDVRKSAEPFFGYKNERLDITLLNFHNEEVKMYVYGKSNNLLYEKNLGSDFTIHHAVDLSGLQFGSYEVVLANQEDIYEYNISVK